MKSTLLFGKRIEFDPHLDYGIKNSRHEFGLLKVESFLKKLDSKDKLVVMSFLQERIYELKYMVKLKKLVSYVYGTRIDLKRESVVLAYMNTIKLFQNILKQLKRESYF